jgi:hypothetical protein
MLHNSKRALAYLQHACAVLGFVCVSHNAWAISVSPSPSSDGTYTVSWPAWGATGCTYTYYEPFLTYSCYLLEELTPGGTWAGVSLPDYSTSWTATGKTPGIYEYRLQYAYGDISGGSQYVIDGPVAVEVLSNLPPPPLPPEQIPPDLENPPFRCNVVNIDLASGQPADVSASSWFWDTFWGYVYPITYPAELRHTTDDPSCLMIGPSEDWLIPSPMILWLGPGPILPIPGTPWYAVQYFDSFHEISSMLINTSYCAWLNPFPCEVAGTFLALGIDPINWKWIGRWAVHFALVIPY